MKINVLDHILDYDGKPFLNVKNEPMTFREVFSNSLNGSIPGETVPAETKSKMFQISKKLYDSKEPDFTVEQLALIKERVGVAYNSPLIYGRVCELIDGGSAN